MSEVIVYGYCDANCKHTVLTVDQVVDLIQEMAANGFQVPENYIPKTAVNGIIDQNSGRTLSFWLGTQAKWDSYTGDKTNMFAIISDDQTLKNILTRLDEVSNTLTNMANGKIPLSVKKNDGTMGQIIQDANGVLKFGDVVIPQQKIIFNTSTNLNEGVTYTLNEPVKQNDRLIFLLNYNTMRFTADFIVPEINAGLSTIFIHLTSGTSGLNMFDAYLYFNNDTQFVLNSISTLNNANYDIAGMKIAIEKIYKVID